jgi:hypothetical protein
VSIRIECSIDGPLACKTSIGFQDQLLLTALKVLLYAAWVNPTRSECDCDVSFPDNCCDIAADAVSQPLWLLLASRTWNRQENAQSDR